LVDQWFFIRYGDPEFHLRVRFRGRPAALTNEVLPALQALLGEKLETGNLWKISVDTYEREVERYAGPHGIELVERIFEADSESVLGLLEAWPEGVPADARWHVAMLGLHTLLDDLGLDLRERAEVLRPMREASWREYRVGVGFEKSLGLKYRRERALIEQLLARRVSELEPAIEVLRARSARNAPIIAELASREERGLLTLRIRDIAPSLMHMLVNRLYATAARAHELVLYDFLSRTYDSHLARERKKSGSQ
jgi:thiopeptide-type bacteriocin biosynthesis protein